MSWYFVTAVSQADLHVHQTYIHSNDLHSTALHLQTPFIQSGRPVCDPTRLCFPSTPPSCPCTLLASISDPPRSSKSGRGQKRLNRLAPRSSISASPGLDAFLKYLGFWS
ncbi:hypothetical protein NW761_002342 [Fusarium oxysporum]|nr:hypothetical protein NW763_006321 [Fusarium oxysporum]KAJ4060291.1 hypothetical protein NW758_000838 [Fusarium oxysporum]KAJ4063014.1 hypothetical protein NW753_004480 [Fusarium oxysporum]KAJ4103547.1 hypothetical protein NW761_002342 [Fusarium oxysporum]KAJ4104766.1 hypothetical protein NW756_000530 [Fusarium oxysporum]